MCAVLVIFSGCIKMAVKKYKLGRQFGDIKKEEYLRQISIENAVDPSLFLYPDSASYIPFGSSSSINLYYGCFINDSVSIKKSDFLLDNQSCIGRINKEIENIIISRQIDSFAKDTGINLSRLNFLRLADDQKVKLVNGEKKLSIILIYMYAFGTYYKGLYKEITDVCKKYEQYCDLHIISMDPIYIQQISK
ncbi:hypothetical protein EGI32_18925 [Ferruginibacter sp. HRS2-29]|nr:hypothetical protein [Ferruginibacter sp. HRS2-29]